MGRPLLFDKEKAIDTAMQCFWLNGYNNTGVAALVDEIGIKPSSFYSAFGSKEELFCKALTHYAVESLKDIDTLLHSDPDPVKAVELLMRDIAITPDNRGCLLVNSILEVGRNNEKVRTHIQSYFDAIERRLADHITTAIQNKKIINISDPQTVATALLTFIWGLRVLGQTASIRQKLDGVLQQIRILLPAVSPPAP